MGAAGSAGGMNNATAVLELDEDGYPTEAALDAIAAWPYQDAEGCMEAVRRLWHWQNFVSVSADEIGDPVYDFSTGGWSGNESLIGALKQNTMIWALCWWSSERGGHHVFKVRRPRITCDTR